MKAQNRINIIDLAFNGKSGYFCYKTFHLLNIKKGYWHSENSWAEQTINTKNCWYNVCGFMVYKNFIK